MREKIEELSARLGADPLLVQGAGGNISWKEGDLLWVKASGMCMRDAQARDIFVPVNLADAQDLSRPVAIDPRWADQVQLRPSIETIFHALMPQQVVVHLHSVALIAKLIMRDCEAEVATFLEDRRHALVPYRKPGANLAESVKEVLQDRSGVDVLLLANHGIVIAAETVEAITERLEELLSSLPAPERQRPAEWAISAPPSGFRAVDDDLIHDLAFDEQAFYIAESAWAITPDHVVFLGAVSNTFDSIDELERSPAEPTFAIVHGAGVYLSNAGLPSPVLVEEMLMFFRNVTMRVADPIGVRTLSDVEVKDLLGWEAEKYRQALNSIDKSQDHDLTSCLE